MIGEDLTDHQILELIFGANNKTYDLLAHLNNDQGGKKEFVDPLLVTVSRDNFKKILSRDLNEDKKKVFTGQN